MASASTATATMAASAEEDRALAFEAIEASGESRYPEEQENPQGQQDEEAAAATEQQHPVTRQSSLLNLTLEEIQNTVCEPGKNFGSMNMDEFLSNIWTAEEGTAMASTGGGGLGEPGDQPGGGSGRGGPDAASNAGTPSASLYRQGSVSLPANLCRKTVDEVWSEIQRDKHRQQQQPPPPPPPPQGHMQAQQYQSPGGPPRQPTFGEMTLEDFLIKAGIVREGGYQLCSSPQHLNQFPLPTSPSQQPQQSQYGLPGTYPVGHERPVYGPIQMTMGYGEHQNPGPTANGVYHNYHQQQQQAGVGNGFGGGGVSYRGCDSGGGGRMGNGHVGVGSPVSPVSSDGFGGRSQVDNSSGNPGGQWGADAGTGSRASNGGRKRILDGPVDKVMERRQRRMIKNRESAARSRARKQAYTVELETELNHLKEENARLHEEHRRLTARRRQMLVEAMAQRARARISSLDAKALRHCSSCVW